MLWNKVNPFSKTWLFYICFHGPGSKPQHFYRDTEARMFSVVHKSGPIILCIISLKIVGQFGTCMSLSNPSYQRNTCIQFDQESILLQNNTVWMLPVCLTQFEMYVCIYYCFDIASIYIISNNLGINMHETIDICIYTY